MRSDLNRQVRHKSMLGTALLVVGVIATIVFAVLGPVWAVAAGLVVCGLALVLLYQVGKAIS